MVQMLKLAQTMGVLKLGNIALDGSKIKANASKHSPQSYGRIQKQEAHLNADITKLLALAEAADNQVVPDGMDISDEIPRREDLLAAIAIAKIKIEERAQPRFDVEQADYADKMAKRAKRAA